MTKHLKDFSVSEIIYNITAYRGFSGENLDFFDKSQYIGDTELDGVNIRYYVYYKTKQVLRDVSEQEVKDFFDLGEYLKHVDI